MFSGLDLNFKKYRISKKLYKTDYMEMAYKGIRGSMEQKNQIKHYITKQKN